MRLGLLASRCEVALFTDADLSTPITETPKLVTLIFSGECGSGFGSRALDRKLIGVHQPWRREQEGRVFNLAACWRPDCLSGTPQCGFKAFRMQVCRPLIEGATIDRFGFDVELIYLAYRAGLRLRKCRCAGNYEGSKVNVFSDSFKMLSEVGLIRRQARRGVYEQAIKAAQELIAK